MGKRDPNNVWNWPEDRATTEEKNVLYTDNMKSELYKEAIEPLEWLVTTVPNLNPSIYINGAKIYEELANKEESPEEKIKYQERALEMYDLRIKYFNNEAEVLNRKAFTAYKFYKSTKPKYSELMELFSRAFEVNGINIYDNNLIAYMDVIRRFKLTGGSISDEDVLEVYSTVTGLIDKKIAGTDDPTRLEAIADNVDKVLAATITVDCEFVENNLGPKLDDNPEDEKLARKFFQLMLTGKCTDSPLAVKAAKTVHHVEPSFGLAKFIATKSQADGETESAVKYFNEALELADDSDKRGDTYLGLARLYAAKGRKIESRRNALRAVSESPNLREAYSLIGNLYLSSYEDCREGISKVQDRAVFIAAYEMYNRAGNSQAMSEMKAQFPSMEEIFNEGKELGDSMTVGCWINETVRLDRRPAQLMASVLMLRLFTGLVLVLSFACTSDNKDILEKPKYEGPQMEMDSVETLYSDSAKVKIRIQALKRLHFPGGDEEYPLGVFLEFYDKEGQITSTFKSDKAFYIAEEKHYKGEGNVMVRNLESGDELNTEELFWSPGEEKVFTDKFVTIKSEGEVHTGEGLIANQDFDNYQILKPTGTLTIEDGL